MNQDEFGAHLQSSHESMLKELDRITAEYPAIPTITAIIMAGDYASMAFAETLVKDGTPPWTASHSIGSFARMDFLLKYFYEDRLPESWLTVALAEDWASSEPDDTDERFLLLWKQAKSKNGAAIVTGSPLPEQSVVTVYRGQCGETLGISWSLSRTVAEKFARGASFRVPVSGRLLMATVRREDILAYITCRGEEEVILDPQNLIGVSEA